MMSCSEMESKRKRKAFLGRDKGHCRQRLGLQGPHIPWEGLSEGKSHSNVSGVGQRVLREYS